MEHTLLRIGAHLAAAAESVLTKGAVAPPRAHARLRMQGCSSALK
jgi:hypothetical protein